FPLARWFEDLTGPAVEPLRDISGGAWRDLRADGAGLPAHPGQERRKLLLTTGRGRFLLKFAGLGAGAEAKFARARALHAEGFTPEPLALRHGFLLEQLIEGARPLDPSANRPALVDCLGRYLGFRARAFPAGPGDGAAPDDLAEMIRVNASEALDPASGERLSGRFRALIAGAPPARPVHIDGRLHGWEWLRLRDGRLLKTDALDHSNAHDLIGCQDIAWDVAGAVVEFGFTDEEAEDLLRRVEQLGGGAISSAYVEALRLAYAAFQVGLWSLATDPGARKPREVYRAELARSGVGQR
ncbi:MAG TPA: hypothetical protein VEA15_00945, partial [Caulobacteraceae bacterium]|nr:hypothetical protein [Caulobacteraceae bacterium]